MKESIIEALKLFYFSITLVTIGTFSILLSVQLFLSVTLITIGTLHGVVILLMLRL